MTMGMGKGQHCLYSMRFGDYLEEQSTMDVELCPGPSGVMNAGIWGEVLAPYFLQRLLFPLDPSSSQDPVPQQPK